MKLAGIPLHEQGRDASRGALVCLVCLVAEAISAGGRRRDVPRSVGWGSAEGSAGVAGERCVGVHGWGGSRVRRSHV